MGRKKLLFMRGGIHKEFAYRTFFRKDSEMMMMDTPACDQLAFADYPYIINNNRDTEEMFHCAMKIYKEKGFDGVCTFMNSPVTAIGRLSDHLGLDYFSEETGRILSSKYEVRKFLRSVGAEDVKFFKVTSLQELQKSAEQLKYPFILKPTDNASGKGVIVVRNAEELESSFKYSIACCFGGELLAEELIEGDEYCVEIMIHNHEIYILSISKKYVTGDRYCIELMDITPAPMDEEARLEIEGYMKETVSRFNISNMLIHIEFRLNREGRPVIIEINPRSAGGNLIESIYHLKGLNVYDYYYDSMMKNEIDTAKLKKQVEAPFSGFSLFYSFISPTRSGVIKKIRGMDKIREKMDKIGEKLILFYNEGAYLPEPQSNLEFRGSMYIFGSDAGGLIERAKEIESLLDYQFEEQ